MNHEEPHDFKTVVNEALRVPFSIASGLAIVAIAGWIGIAVSDHYDIRELKRDRDEMKPRVEVLWHTVPHAPLRTSQHPQSHLSAN